MFQPQTIADLLRKEVPRFPMYIEPAILPKGGTMVMGGAAKIGKSFVIKTMMRALASGTPLFGLGQFAVPGPVRTLYVENEIGEYGLQKRGSVIWGDMRERELENMYYITKEEAYRMKLDAPLTAEDGFNAWKEVVKVIAPEVLIIDPIAAFHTSDENDSIAIEKLFTRIELLKSIHPERRMAVIIVHHAGKPAAKREDGRDPLDPYSFRGSSKFFDRADSLFMLNRKKNIPNLNHEAWILEGRFTLRQGEGFDDVVLHVNELGDGQVRFNSFKSAAPGGMPRLKIVHVPPGPDTLGGKQLTFEPAE